MRQRWGSRKRERDESLASCSLHALSNWSWHQYYFQTWPFIDEQYKRTTLPDDRNIELPTAIGLSIYAMSRNGLFHFHTDELLQELSQTHLISVEQTILMLCACEKGSGLAVKFYCPRMPVTEMPPGTDDRVQVGNIRKTRKGHQRQLVHYCPHFFSNSFPLITVKLPFA